MWKSHLDRWPEASDSPSGADRVHPDDPPGSWRGDGNRYLNPEQNAEVGRIIELLRRPEKAVSELLQKIQQDNPHGGFLAGLDHRLKDDQRLKEKIADKMVVKIDGSAADAARTINDALRYTFCFSTDQYVRGYGDVHQRLESAGYRMTYRKNHWLDDHPQYKGINSRWDTPDGGRFELQFHTPESFFAKEHLTRPSYRRLRSPETSRPEQRELMAFQAQVSAAVPAPTDISRIPDHQVRT